MLDVQAAKQAGYTDQEIQAYMASKQPKTGLVGSVVKSITSPYINTAKNVGAAGFEVARAVPTAFKKNDNNKYSLYVNPETGKEVDNPFVSDQELAKLSQPLSLDKGSALRQQVSDSANIGAWAVPFGKGTGVAQKALLPGAGVGVLTSIDPNVDVSELPEKMIEGAAKGAALSGLLYGGTQAFSKAKGAMNKTGDKLQQEGTNFRQGVRQVRLKPEVGGAQKEQSVNKVLDDLGFAGTPQQQYEKLQPTMTKLEKIIKEKLAVSPLKFDKKAIRNEIVKELEEQGFLIGAKAKKTASQALDDVMDDVVTKGGKDLGSMQLFLVKQKLNKISQRISDKMDRGLTVSPTDEVMMATRDALDGIIAKYHPDVKDLTLAQSSLFDSARSLSSARTNAPVFRVAGTSLPAAITTRGKARAGQIAEGGGNLIKNLAGGIPESTGYDNVISKFINKSPKNITSNVVARTPSLVGGINQVSEEENNAQNGYKDQTANNESYTQLDTSNDHNNIIPPETTPVNPYGATVEELGQLYALALGSGDKKAISQLKELYDVEMEYQKNYGSKAGQRLPASNVATLAEMETAIQLMPKLWTLYEESRSVFNPALGKIRTINPYDKDAQKANTTIFLVKQIIGKGLEGGVLRKEDEYKYEKILPKLTDTPSTVEAKIQLLEQVLQEKYDTYISGYQQAGYNPYGGAGLTPTYDSSTNPLLTPFTQ